MVKTGFNLIIALLILRLLTKRCYGKESCDEKVNKIIKKEQINSFENRNQSKIHTMYNVQLYIFCVFMLWEKKCILKLNVWLLGEIATTIR